MPNNKTISTNLATFAEKLATGKWLIKPSAHSRLCKQVDGLMKHPSPMADDLVPPTNYVPAGTEGDQTAVHAIIHVQGILSKNVSEEAELLLGLTDVDWISELLDATANDPSVNDITINFTSPGGETTGIEELGRKIDFIDKNVKPVYCFTENQCDSAAFWLFSQGRMVGMTPSAQCGGVGVYVLVLDETRKMKMEGCEIIPISSGKYKLLGHEFHELTKEEKNIIQEDVDKQHRKFKNVILSKRPDVSEDDLEGLSFNGEDALAKHLVDVLADNINTFLSTIEQEQYMYNNNMKPSVTTTEVKTPVKTEEAPAPKKLSIIEKLKQLMGEYDGSYGQPEDEHPTDNFVPDVQEVSLANDDTDDEKDEDEMEMDYKAEIANIKSTLAEVMKKLETPANTPPAENKMEEQSSPVVVVAQNETPAMVSQSPELPTKVDLSVFFGKREYGSTKHKAFQQMLTDAYVETVEALKK